MAVYTTLNFNDYFTSTFMFLCVQGHIHCLFIAKRLQLTVIDAYLYFSLE